MYFIVSQQGHGKYLADRLPEAIVTKMPNDSGVNIYVGGPGILPPNGMINTSQVAMNYMTSRDVNKQIREHLGVVDKPAVTNLYGFFNGQQFGPWLEAVVSTRFMNREVGPNVGVTLGVGYTAGNEPSDAIPNLSDIKEFLVDAEYRGEVLLQVTSDFQICGLQLGHMPAFLGMFGEVLKGPMDNVMRFVLQECPVYELYTSVVTGTLVSLWPFPGNLAPNEKKILAPASAEKHLWRLSAGNAEPVWITTHGQSLQQARARMNQTLLNIAKTEPSVQYRTDLGFGVNLLFSPGSLDVAKRIEVPETSAPPQ